MGEVFLDMEKRELCIISILVLYGDAAHHELAQQMAKEVTEAWNEPQVVKTISGQPFQVRFQVTGNIRPGITPDEIHANLDPKMNYFRVESFSRHHISFVDEIGCNSGYFLVDNLLNDSKTAAHEYGHTLGLLHPEWLDIRGQGQPGIMYPRGTLVDPPFQWDPAVPAGTKGGTLNPMYRRVLPSDIDNLHLEQLELDRNGKGILGDFTNLYHVKH